LHQRHALARKAASRRSHWPDREAALASLQGRGIFKGWADAALQAYVEHAIGDCGEAVVLKCRPSREVEIFSSFPRRMWASLAAISTPTQVLYGEHTYPFVPHSVSRLAALNPNVTAQQVAGGHCFMQEDPGKAADQVLDFLQG
ncbi:alpha/beta hydrolase, partial [Pseudomonas sp. CM25]|uniref:alpha/beta fold hydrolase n=1 Tax=Pseudomonas sp. CM25 TaxID=2738448 RepID=UPI001557C607